MTTPNSIESGMQMIPTQSTKQVKEGYGSFIHKLQKDAIVIKRIVSSTQSHGKYIGSAMVGDHAGDLTTGEHYQIKPKDKKDLFYILHYLRSDFFQEIVEEASGTGGQQRVYIESILDMPIPKPTDASRKQAKKELVAIDQNNAKMKKIRDGIVDRANKIKRSYTK